VAVAAVARHDDLSVGLQHDARTMSLAAPIGVITLPPLPKPPSRLPSPL
jgi:hypothetical protein